MSSMCAKVFGSTFASNTASRRASSWSVPPCAAARPATSCGTDRKSTRLNSSHVEISYAVFCLNDTRATELVTLSLHDALPILQVRDVMAGLVAVRVPADQAGDVFHVREGLRVDLRVEHGVEAREQLVGAAVRGGEAGDVLRHRSEEHTSELQSRRDLVCRLLLE